MELRLEARSGPDAGTTFRYEGFGVVVFGRAGTPDRGGRRPKDPSVSREHLWIEVTREGVCAVAVHAGATLRVAGRAGESAALRDGDELRVGASDYRVGVDDAEGAGDDERRVEPVVARRRLADFDLGAEIGRGSWGVVHEARDRETGSTVAVKVLRPDVRDETVRRYFAREIDIAAGLSHPNVVRTLAVGEEGGPLFLAMERVDGPDLDRFVSRRGLLPARRAAEVGIAVLRALAHAHAAGIVHRDVKPANVLVTERGGALEARVADFGLARRFRQAGATTLTGTGEARGTLQVAAPEALRDASRAGPAAVLCGVGASIYHALTGGPWYDVRGSSRPFEAILHGRLRPLREARADVPPDLAAAVERSLRLDPRDRPASAAAMLAELVSARVE
jgi:serine/threonine-protein kinase